MWTTDDLSSEERGRICALVRFINYAQLELELSYSEYISSGDVFMEFIELISNCPKRGLYFKPFEDVDGTPKPAGFFTPEEVVSYLFDKVELRNWKITWLQYHKDCLTSMDGDKLDLVYVTLRPS